jgi:LMBR1 domain-containing protein 1
MWLVVYIIDVVLVFYVIPFAMFYYEDDQEKSCAKRVFSASTWVIVTVVVVGLVLNILYSLVGKIYFTIQQLSSPTISFPNTWSTLSLPKNCSCLRGTNGNTQLCDAYIATAS